MRDRPVDGLCFTHADATGDPALAARQTLRRLRAARTARLRRRGYGAAAPSELEQLLAELAARG